VIRRAPLASPNEIWILNVSGRGDKDMEILAQHV
jgi:tryptophan synthase beta subunit